MDTEQNEYYGILNLTKINDIIIMVKWPGCISSAYIWKLSSSCFHNTRSLVSVILSLKRYQIPHLSHAVFDKPGKSARVCVASTVKTGHVKIDDMVSLDDIRH